MLPGFLGTLIAVERAVAHRSAAAWLAPLLLGAGTLAALGSDGSALARAAVAAGSLALVGVLVTGFPSLRAPAQAVQVAAAACLAVGSLSWAAGAPIYAAVPWWMAFPLLTIAGERLDLSRVVEPPLLWRRAFAGVVGLALLGLLLGELSRDAGMRLQGLAWTCLAAWLWRFDLARRTWRRPGLSGFMGVAILSGYAWLALGGLGALFHGVPPAGPVTDGILHAYLLGFVFPMIFAHAPVIFPAVLGVELRFRRSFHAHLWLLHAGLALRVVGDVAWSLPLRQLGAWLNAAAVLLFLLQTVASIRPRGALAGTSPGPRSAQPS